MVIRSELSGGVWRGLISYGAPTQPQFAITHNGTPLPALTVSPGEGAPGTWQLSAPVPLEAIGDGVQVFTISDTASGKTLGHFTLMAGDALSGNLTAEVALLRAELEMVKRALRRHLSEIKD